MNIEYNCYNSGVCDAPIELELKQAPVTNIIEYVGLWQDYTWKHPLLSIKYLAKIHDIFLESYETAETEGIISIMFVAKGTRANLDKFHIEYKEKKGEGT